MPHREQLSLSTTTRRLFIPREMLNTNGIRLGVYAMLRIDKALTWTKYLLANDRFRRPGQTPLLRKQHFTSCAAVASSLFDVVVDPWPPHLTLPSWLGCNSFFRNSFADQSAPNAALSSSLCPQNRANAVTRGLERHPVS